MHIALIAKPGHLDSGVGRYTQEHKKALEALGHRVTVVHPIVLLPSWLLNAIRSWTGWDLAAFFYNYPVWTRYPQSDIYHFTSQNMATLLLTRRPPGKAIVTVHDIIPWITRYDQELQVYRHRLEALFDYLAVMGIRRADAVIADSDYTAHCLHKEQLISPDTYIAIVSLGII